MAASRPISTIKELVSKRRKRYTEDGFNLDLAYITDQVIAMGFPAEKLEGIYRNHIDEVKRFLDLKHKNQYKVYNLCSERKYDLCRFEHVERYPFDDHNPPKIQLIKDFCDDVHKWLSADNGNVAAVHCKAGKGRTGTMICCYLLYSGKFKTAEEALKYYGVQRTHDQKGVTIPSQRRYVEYYSYLLKSGKLYNPIALHICEIKLSPPPLTISHPGTISYSISTTNSKKHCAQGPQLKKQDSCVTIRLDICIPLDGDVKVEFFWTKMLRNKDKLFHFWFNTFFVDELATVLPNGNLSYKLKKHELDDAHKDKSHKIYPADFEVEVIMQKIPSGPFAKPRSNITDNILTQQSNLWYHHNTNSYQHSYNNSYNNLISVGGPGYGTGYDQVDSSNNTSLDARPTNPLVDTQIPSETSETSSSSEPSSSSEEWESGECCDQIISKSSSKVIEKVRSSNDIFDDMQAINNDQLDVKCGVNFIRNNSSSTVTVENDDHDDNDREVIHLDYSLKEKKKNNVAQKSHYNDDNYYLGSSVSLAVVASTIPISCPPNNKQSKSNNSDHQSQSPTTIHNASPPITKILSQRKKFKAKTGSPHGSVTSSTGKKIRWLVNMKSDPDFRETLNKNVHFRSATTGLSPVRTSNDSLNSDYYSSICDKQLSFGSPAKSPSDFMRLSRVKEQRSHEECPDIVIATKKKVTPEFCTPPPPNTPTSPCVVATTDDSRKSPAKTENSFKQLFFNFTRRDHTENNTNNISSALPIIKITSESETLPPISLPSDKTSTTTKASSKFSFRDLRHEIQSAIKSQNHATTTTTSNNESNDNNKGNSDKKSKK